MGKRRGHGEGSIYQRASDGVWCTVIDLGFVDGKRKRKYLYGKTRKEVAEKLKVAQRDQQHGLPVAVERQSVAQFLHRWLNDTVRGTVRPRTFESYEDTVLLHLNPTLGHHRLTKLSPQHIHALLQAKQASGLSAQSVKYILIVLRLALNKAVKWNLVPRNVATLVDPPRVERHDIRTFTPEQAQQFLTAVRGDRLEALYTVALALGLRQGEALGLQWDDIDFDREALTVRRSLQRMNGTFTLVQPKTEKSKRTITLPDIAVRALRTHHVLQMEERFQAGTRWQDHALLFTTPLGTPLDRGNVGKRFKALLARAGLPPMRFHDLRHCCASLLLAQNVHPKVVQEILGHSQISMTLDIYSHLLPTAQRAAATVMDQMLAVQD